MPQLVSEREVGDIDSNENGLCRRDRLDLGGQHLA